VVIKKRLSWGLRAGLTVASTSRMVRAESPRTKTGIKLEKNAIDAIEESRTSEYPTGKANKNISTAERSLRPAAIKDRNPSSEIKATRKTSKKPSTDMISPIKNNRVSVMKESIFSL
jgi:hypothetical protein